MNKLNSVNEMLTNGYLANRLNINIISPPGEKFEGVFDFLIEYPLWPVLFFIEILSSIISIGIIIYMPITMEKLEQKSEGLQWCIT